MLKDIVLIIGDPLMGAAQLGAQAFELLNGRFDVRWREWSIPLDAAVEANLAIEKGGPQAVNAGFEETAGDPIDDDRVIAVLTQFFPLGVPALDRWPRLRIVATLRAGVENIDTAALETRGITLIANAGRNANAVAELTVALILASLRGVGENHHSIRDGGWRPERPARGYRELAGLRIGLVGVGAVGATVLQRLQGFDLDVAYFDPYVRGTAMTGTSLGLDELLSRSDVVTLHARSTPETRGMIGAAQLDLLPAGATLVNTARAELVDEDALVERLRSGRLGGAGLDVFSIEPLPADHPLRSLVTVTLSPHLAGSTVEARTSAPLKIALKLEEALRSLDVVA